MQSPPTSYIRDKLRPHFGSVILIAFGVVLLAYLIPVHASPLGTETSLLPTVIAVAMILVGVSRLFTVLAESESSQIDSSGNPSIAIGAIAIIHVFALAGSYVGFKSMILLSSAALLYLFRVRRFSTIMMIAGCLTATCILVFEVLLGISLPASTVVWN